MHNALLGKSCPAVITADKLWKRSHSQPGSGHASFHRKEAMKCLRQTPQEALTQGSHLPFRLPRDHPAKLSWLRLGAFWVHFLPGSKGALPAPCWAEMHCFPALHGDINSRPGKDQPGSWKALGGWLLSLTGLVSRPLLITLILCTLYKKPHNTNWSPLALTLQPSWLL